MRAEVRHKVGLKLFVCAKSIAELCGEKNKVLYSNVGTANG